MEGFVADGEGLVDDEDFGIEGDGDGEGEAEEHAGGVGFDGLIDEVSDVGEGGDVVVFLLDVVFVAALYEALEEDIFATGEFGVETGAEFEECGNAALDVDGAGGGLEGAGDKLEEGGFPGAVASDDAPGLSFGDVEGEGMECGEGVGGVGGGTAEHEGEHFPRGFLWRRKDLERAEREMAGGLEGVVREHEESVAGGRAWGEGGGA